MEIWEQAVWSHTYLFTYAVSLENQSQRNQISSCQLNTHIPKRHCFLSIYTPSLCSHSSKAFPHTILVLYPTVIMQVYRIGVIVYSCSKTNGMPPAKWQITLSSEKNNILCCWRQQWWGEKRWRTKKKEQGNSEIPVGSDLRFNICRFYGWLAWSS